MPIMIRENGRPAQIAEELLGRIVTISNGDNKTAKKRKKKRSRS